MGNTNQKPRELATTNTHNVVYKLISSEKKGKILDIPCGEGAMSIKLKELGFDVTGVDIDISAFIPINDIPFIKADLNKEIPIDSNSYDHIVCVEGLEHLENHFLLIREFGRIIKQNGVLILTTPNTLNVYNRLRYFLFGSREVIQDIIDKRKEKYQENIKELWHHPNPIDFPYLRNILTKNGFKIEEITTNRSIREISPKNILKKLLYNITLLVCAIIIKVANICLPVPPKSHDITIYPLLWGEGLIIKARKL